MRLRRLHLLGKQKRKPLFLCVKYDLKAVYKGKYDPKKDLLIINFLKAQNKKCLCMEPEPHGTAFYLPGAGADPIWLEPESAPGPRTSGAAQKSGCSATLRECK